jgi:sialate O-acetylesterase
MRTFPAYLALLLAVAAATAQTTNPPSAPPAANSTPALRIPSIIGDHMVLQQKLPDPIWGRDTAGTKVTVEFAGQSKSAVAGPDGKWMVKLDPMPATATPGTMTITGSSRREIRDVLVGEVWLCSGQSNMQFKLIDPQLVGDSSGDLEAAQADLPLLRLVTVPNVASQEPKDDFKGQWEVSSPETAAKFSAVGFFFGRTLQRILHVPVGLINDAWGGSAAEAWIRREALERDPRFAGLVKDNVSKEAFNTSDQARRKYQEDLAKWELDSQAAKAAFKKPPTKPQSPEGWMAGNKRVGNIFGGVLAPTIGYGIKGVIWYQGESNVSRASEYGSLFPFLIEQWRKEWGQGDFPFYWVQLANHMPRKSEPGESAWAELREAQTKTMSLTNTGQAVAIDLGEGKDVHPRNKHDVAARLVRWALTRDYGVKLPYRSPEFQKMDVSGDKVTVTFDCHGSRLRTFGVHEVKGFALCGGDHAWHWADGEISGTNSVTLSSKEVPLPVAVRYAWADNPDCNLYAEEDLPATPFRTDNFPMITGPKPPVQAGAKP